MKNREYKAINKILKSELSDESVLKILEVARQLMPIVDGVLETNIEFEKQEFSECNVFAYHNARKYICNRLTLFYRELVRMMSNGEVHYSRNFAGNASCDNYTGELWLGRSDTIQDDLFFVHEFIHHMNLKPINDNPEVDQKNLLRSLFGEALSIAAELDFVDKLEDDKLKKDAVKAEVNYSLMIKECALKVKVEMFLIDLYLKHGGLSEDIIKSAIKECDDVELALMVSNNYEDILGEINGWGANLKFIFNLKYVLGVVVGYSLFDRIKDDKDMIYKLAIICRRMYELTVDDFCTLFNIDLTDPLLIERFRNRVNELRPIVNGMEKKVTE